MENFRIVSDSNNKIQSMAGKHVEMKKWIIVEEDAWEMTGEDETEGSDE